VRVQKPQLKIQMLFRATGGRSRRARNGSFTRGNMCLLRSRSRRRRRRRRRRVQVSPCLSVATLFHVSRLVISFIVIIIVLSVLLVQNFILYLRFRASSPPLLSPSTT